MLNEVSVRVIQTKQGLDMFLGQMVYIGLYQSYAENSKSQPSVLVAEANLSSTKPVFIYSKNLRYLGQFMIKERILMPGDIPKDVKFLVSNVRFEERMKELGG